MVQPKDGSDLEVDHPKIIVEDAWGEAMGGDT